MTKYKNIIIIFTFVLIGGIVTKVSRLYRISRVLIINGSKFRSEIFKIYNITWILIILLVVSLLLVLFLENKKNLK